MIIKSPQEVLNIIFDNNIKEYIFYEGNINELFSYLDNLDYEYSICGYYSDTHTLYNIYFTFEQSGILAIKD